ncbi:MAG: hypothetical protein M9897_05695 [Brumimicrobium sp.]|nr:hypothetical protein [Brumimicrobium sp.]
MGNIEKQIRHNRAGDIFDNLEYHYQKENGKLVRNRLYSVSDYAPANVMDDDIKDMIAFNSDPMFIETANNYAYDAEGRLVRDDQEEIDTIIWTATGKVKEIRRTLASSKKNLIFDYTCPELVEGIVLAKELLSTCTTTKQICSKKVHITF